MAATINEPISGRGSKAAADGEQPDPNRASRDELMTLLDIVPKTLEKLRPFLVVKGQ